MTSGGKRLGSGRKPFPPEEKRVRLCLTVAPETKRAIEQLKADGVKVGVLIDDLIGAYVARTKK